jgi:hypothetical protein
MLKAEIMRVIINISSSTATVRHVQGVLIL